MAISKTASLDTTLLQRLLGSDFPNRQGEISSLSLTKTVQEQVDCQECFEMALQAHIYLIRQKYQKALSLWKACGCPDLGAWPDLHTDLFLVSYLRMSQVLCPVINHLPTQGDRWLADQTTKDKLPQRQLVRKCEYLTQQLKQARCASTPNGPS